MGSARNDGEALLRAVLDSPDDDGPRLAYAAWLERHGDAVDQARAKFIRLQVKEARLKPGGPSAVAYHCLALDLKQDYAQRWLQDAPDRTGLGFSWERGFVFSVHGTAKRFLAHADDLFRQFPLRNLSIDRLDGRAGQLFACPHLARLKYLSLRKPGEAGAVALARCPYLANLSTLNLRQGQGIGPAGAQALAAAPHLAGLTHLYLCRASIGAGGAEAVAGSPHLRQLVALELDENNIGPAGARALAASKNLAGVTVLDLRSNHIGDEGLVALLDSPHLKELRDLDLSYNCITDAGAAALAQWRGLANCQALRLRGSSLTDVGALAFAGAKGARKLKSLWLEGEFSPAAVEALGKAPNLKKAQVSITNHWRGRANKR
jgi:uncharacterized protein (TIGR02996 family)